MDINIKFLKFFKRNFHFKFTQASFKEIIEFDYYLQREGFIINHIFELLNKWNPSFKIKHYNKLTVEDFNKIFIFIVNNYCKSFYGSLNKEQAKSKGNEVPFFSVISFIIQNSNESIDSILEQSWEAIDFIYQGIIWNLNEQTKEGNAMNRSSKLKKELNEGKYDKTLERIRKNREKIMGNLKFN